MEDINVNLLLIRKYPVDKLLLDVIELRNRWHKGHRFTCIPIIYRITFALERLQKQIFNLK